MKNDFKLLRLQSPVKSVGMKLFMIFFICIVVLVLVVGLFSYSQSKDIIEKKVSASTEQMVTQASDKLENVLRNPEDITNLNMQDKEI